MDLLVKRRPATDGAILGDLFIDGARFSFTLERLAVCIPPGRFRVRLTVSRRAIRGELYTPDPQNRLPLIEDVPGRDAIRLHAFNTASQSLGCVGVGDDVDATLEARAHRAATLEHSRAALDLLVARIDAAEQRNEDVFITIEAAGAPQTVAV